MRWKFDSLHSIENICYQKYHFFFGKNPLISSFILHSIPTQNESRQQWIDAINKHQNVDLTGRLRYFLCQLHFEPASVKILQSKTQLTKGTVPTIFADNATETTETEWKAPRNPTGTRIDRWANLQFYYSIYVYLNLNLTSQVRFRVMSSL